MWQSKLGSQAAGFLLAGMIAVQLCSAEAFAAEVCHFTGNTDYDGHVAVTTAVAATGGVTRVDVIANFESTTTFWLRLHYMLEEVSSWRGGELENVAVNSRYLIGNHIVRQQWDDFQRDHDGMLGHRVQAKNLGDFRHKHPGFVQHWDPATFGQPWLRDYPAASPERRADLDLKGSSLPSGLRSPLAMAFYWVRWLPHDGQEVPVFLPGFKADRLVDLPITAARAPDGTLWKTPLRYPALSKTPTSEATAHISSDGHLLQLAFELHEARGSARGVINQVGCEGAPVAPVDQPR
ncbi:MAG: hypothetical protein WA864_20395 [Acetobacteraceae bacterium]|jgi:hypothetical protein